MEINNKIITEYIYKIAEDFGSPAKDAILYMNFGKHIFEISSIIENLNEDGKVLDVGGGLGVNLCVISKIINKSNPLFLIDRFEEYSEENRMGESRRGYKILEDSKIKIINQNFWTEKKLPFKDDFFDIVTIFDVTEHLPGGPLYLLKEIFRILKKGGKILLSGPNSLYILRRIRLLLGKNPYIYFNDWIKDNYYSHYREYDKAEQEELLKLSGFKNIKTTMSVEPSRTQAKNRYYYDKHLKLSVRSIFLYMAYILEILNPNLRGTIYSIAEK